MKMRIHDMDIETEAKQIRDTRAEEARRVTQGYTIEELRELKHINVYRRALDDAIALARGLLYDDGTSDAAIKAAERGLFVLEQLNNAPMYPGKRAA
jgi:hypothetical protein